MKTLKFWIIKAAIVAATLLLMIQLPVLAANPSLKAEAVYAEPGEKVCVGIDATQLSLVSLSLAVEFDESVLTLVSVEDTGKLSGAIHSDKLHSPYILTWENDTSSSNHSVTGTLANMNFVLSSAATEGAVYSIRLNILADGALTCNGSVVSLSLSNGSITVAGQEAHICSFGPWHSVSSISHVRECECGEKEYGRHTWDDGRITVAPGTNTEGEAVYTCTVCGATKTVILPAEDEESEPVINSVSVNKTTATTGETLTWTATATGGNGTLKYCFYVFKDGAVVKRGDYGTARTYTYIPTAAGVYTVRVYVKDGAGTVVTQDNAGKVTVSGPLTISSVKANKTSANTGESITWTATATGGSGTLKYCFYVFKNGTVVERGEYGTAKTYTYKPTAAGAYTVRVYVKDGAGTVATQDNAGKVTVSGPLTISSVKANKTTANTGDTLTWTATATGGSGTLKYCFYVFRNGTVVERGSYGTAKTYTYTPTAAGAYTVRVYVKDGAGTVVTQDNAGKVTVTASATPLTISSVKANKTSANTGESITWTATAAGGSGTLKYCFYVFKNGTVVERGEYGTAKTYTYKPTAAGAYTVRVYVKDGAGTVAMKDNAAKVTVSVPLTISSVKANKTSASTGDTITWTATATGGSGTLKYCFYVFKNGTVVERGNYGTARAYAYTPTAAGAYTVRVYVKDGAGTVATQDNAAKVNVTASATPLTISSIKANNTDASVGDTITWTATASGGSGTLKYCFYVFRNDTVVERGSYGTARTYTYTPQILGIYTVRVYVKDGTGTSINKTSDIVLIDVFIAPDEPGI